MRKSKYNPARVYNNVHLNFDNSRNVSMEKLRTLDPNPTFRNTKNSFDEDESGHKITYDVNDSKGSGRGKSRPNKTSRKTVRRGTTEEAKFYPHVPNFQYQVSPIPSHANMANINFQEGANLSLFTNQRNKLSNRITSRRNFTNANASMLSRENTDILSEGRIREGNETAAPNVLIYQKVCTCFEIIYYFKILITYFLEICLSHS